VETVADGLVQCAAALAGLAELPAVRAQLLKREPAKQLLSQRNRRRSAAPASGPEGGDSSLEAKCRSQPLVLVMGRGRREVYWQGQRLDVDWSIHQAPWDLLATLAERACSLQGADTFDLEGGRRSRLKDRRHRLIRFLPASLNEKIHPAGRGTYKLALRPEEICLLQYAEAERLAELPTCRTN